MSKRGETWSNEETLAIIAIWGEQEIQKKLSNCHKNSDIYKIISDKLKKVNGYERDLGQCRTKIKHLKIMYKKYKDSLASSGAGRRKPPKFFDELDRFLGDKPDATGIENSIDTSDSTSEISNEVEDESVGNNDIDSDLVQKYGEGSMYEKACPECGYNVELQSTGVHFGDNGCVKVYCEDDEFHCPKCFFTDKESGKVDVEPRNKRKIESSEVKKGKKAKKETAVERAMGKFTEYQKDSDKAFLGHMKEQAKVEADLRSQELKAFSDSMALLAGAIAGNRPNPTTAHGSLHNNYHTTIEDDGKTYYSF